MAAYATAADVAARWRPLTTPEIGIANTLLVDAAVRIDAVKLPADPPTDLEIRKTISCAMVKRAMLATGGVTQQSQNSGGLFSQQVTYANPTGDLYLTKDERKLLRRRSSAGSVWMGPDLPETL